jgi:C1A family cysteine protease
MAQRLLRLYEYGWRRDKPDQRDLKYHPGIEVLPVKVDLRSDVSPVVYDQSKLGSSTGQAIAGLLHFFYSKNNTHKSFQPSALFIYYHGRVIENSISEDSGIEIRNGIKSLFRWGICPEHYCPHIVTNFKKKPDKLSYRNTIPHGIEKYLRINQVEHDLKSCLREGYPFVFGMGVYESFETEEVARTGKVPLPDMQERMLGGYAVCCVGYDDEERVFIARASRGSEWGIEGHFKISYEHVLNANLAADFWTFR